MTMCINKTLILIIALCILFVKTAFPQITSSPYSIFGLGTLVQNNIGTMEGMGSTGIALMSEYSINIHNPASYNGFDSLVTIFELGFFGSYTIFNSSDGNQRLVDASIKYVAMGFRLSSRMATSFGLTPYSTIGYNINTKSTIEGSKQLYDKIFSGEGGVNQLYLGSSYKITKNLVFGINATYLFGTVSHSESSEAFDYSLKNTTYLSNFNFNYGLNYQFEIKKLRYTVGLIYNHGKTLTSSSKSTITTNGESEILKSRTSLYKIPKTFGIGLGFEKGFFRGGIDYEIGKSDGFDYNNANLETRNSYKYSGGIEFSLPGARRGTNKMIFYRLGAEYSGTYLVLNGIPINYRAMSFGAGIPVAGALNVINVGLVLGQNGSEKEGLIGETFLTLHLGIALKEHWFMKRNYE
jgi:hypothetical protein